MIKILKQLRIKQEILKENVKFMQQRQSIRRWYKRAQVTKYMRKRSVRLQRQWNLKIMKKCFQAIRENSSKDK